MVWYVDAPVKLRSSRPGVVNVLEDSDTGLLGFTPAGDNSTIPPSNAGTMSTSPFSNPAAGAVRNSAAYIQALLDLLGGREPIPIQRQLLTALGDLTSGLSPEQLVRPEAPGKWSIVQVVQHLAQTELVYAYRYRVVLAEDDPEIPGFDQETWVARLAFDTEDLPKAMTRLHHLRGWNLELLEGLSPDQWQRSGRHAERGVETVRRIADLGAAHDLVHRRQIERIRSTVT